MAKKYFQKIHTNTADDGWRKNKCNVKKIVIPKNFVEKSQSTPSTSSGGAKSAGKGSLSSSDQISKLKDSIRRRQIENIHNLDVDNLEIRPWSYLDGSISKSTVRKVFILITYTFQHSKNRGIKCYLFYRTRDKKI